jgi:hypothetical protein
MESKKTVIVTGASQGIGVASLPLGMPIELDVIFEVADQTGG